jgi:hypothetical protein
MELSGSLVELQLEPLLEPLLDLRLVLSKSLEDLDEVSMSKFGEESAKHSFALRRWPKREVFCL